jgi:hypothetical protein
MYIYYSLRDRPWRATYYLVIRPKKEPALASHGKNVFAGGFHFLPKLIFYYSLICEPVEGIQVCEPGAEPLQSTPYSGR